MLTMYVVWLNFRYWTHSFLFDNETTDGYYEIEDQYDVQLGPYSSIVAALFFTAILFIQANTLVLCLHLMPPDMHSSIAMYCIPIIVPICRHFRALRYAVKNMNIDETLDETLGFSVTLGLFVTPLLVIISWILGSDIGVSLRFDLFGTVAYGIGSWVMAYIVMDGKSNWFEGAELLAVWVPFQVPDISGRTGTDHLYLRYILFVVAFWKMPAVVTW